MYLDPKKNFDHIPPPLRPRRTIRVNQGFGKQLAEVDRNGKRANSGTIGNVMMILDELRQKTHKKTKKVIRRKAKAKAKGKRQTRKH